MVFTLANSLTDTALRFGPARTDIRWDGKSHALVSILPFCPDTAATYLVSVTQVASQETLLFSSLTAYQTTIKPGFPWQYRPGIGTAAPVINSFSISHTVTTSSVVEFELSATTSWTAASTISPFPDLGYIDPLGPSYFSYELKKSLGTAAQVVTFGKLTILPPNPYAENVSVAGNTPTATLCFD
jgi:hypothetical protein